MNIAEKARLVIGPVAAATLLTACTPGNLFSSGPPSQSGASAAPTTSAPTSAPATASPDGSSPTATSSPSGSGSGTGDDCTASELTVQAGAGGGPGATSSGDAISQWNLASSAACTMDGYPGVDLIGIDEGSGQRTRISVPRATDRSPSRVTVEGDSRGELGIEYKPGTSSSSEFKATEMIITPPDTYHQIAYKLPSPWLIATQNQQLLAWVEPVTSGGHP